MGGPRNAAIDQDFATLRALDRRSPAPADVGAKAAGETVSVTASAEPSGRIARRPQPAAVSLLPCPPAPALAARPGLNGGGREGM